MSDLKSLRECPFCGGETTVGHYPETPGMEDETWASCCDKCKAVIWAATEAEAVEAWNTRAELTCGGCVYRTDPSNFWCEECSRYHVDFYAPKGDADAE